jgi:hypothetical protein
VTVRHESLRTVVGEEAGVPYQVVLDPADLHLVLPVRAVDEAELDTVVREAGRRPFDLMADPPLRAELFVLDEREHVLVLTLHHIASDGWSKAPLSRDLATAYAARHSGEAPAWCELPVQYADYTLWQQTLLGDPDSPDSLAGRQLAYWKDALAGAPDELALPFDRPRPADSDHEGAALPLWLDAELQAAIAALARKHDATPFMVLQAGLAMLLRQLGAGADIPLGSVVAGRGDVALDDLVGFFVNTVVLRTDLSQDPSFTELLAQVRETALAVYSHQDVPFEQVVGAANPPRSLSRHPLFQVMLVLQNVTGYEFEMPGLDVSVVEEATRRRSSGSVSASPRCSRRSWPIPGTGSLPPTKGTSYRPDRRRKERVSQHQAPNRPQFKGFRGVSCQETPLPPTPVRGTGWKWQSCMAVFPSRCSTP